MALVIKKAAAAAIFTLLALAALLAILYFSASAVRSYRCAGESSKYQIYVVVLWPKVKVDSSDSSEQYARLRSWHRSFLPGDSALTDSGEPRYIRSYNEPFNGFSARMTVAELEEVAKTPGFFCAFPDRIRRLDYMVGLPRRAKPGFFWLDDPLV